MHGCVCALGLMRVRPRPESNDVDTARGAAVARAVTSIANRGATPPAVDPCFRRNFICRGFDIGQSRPWLPNHNPKPPPAWLGGTIARSNANTPNTAQETCQETQNFRRLHETFLCRKLRISLGLVDLSRTPIGTFFREVHPGSEMASQNDQNKAK